MKKFFLLTAVTAMSMAAAAQTVIAPPTVADAQAAGYEALWGNYDYGYVLPNGTTVTDTEDLKVVVDNGSAEKPGANIATSNLNTTVFDRSFNMGSAAGTDYSEPFYSLADVSAGIKQPYAIFNVEAKKGGELTMYFNRGNNKCTIYVLDVTKLDTEGVCNYMVANTVHPKDLGKDLVSKMTVSLMADHKYWIFGSQNGANINMYEMVFTPIASENYSVTEFDATKFSTTVLPPTVADAQTAGYEALWGNYDYGYVLPNGTTVTDTEDLKVVVDNGSAEKPGANIATSNLNTTVFDRSFNMGSAAGTDYSEPFYSLADVSAGIKQPYAIFTVEAKKGGELTMYFNRGNNKCTMYVLDVTKLETEGVCNYMVSNTVHPVDLGKELVSKMTVGLMADHKYWIFGSQNGANINMYAMGFNNYEAPNYSYTGEGAGVEGIEADSMNASNAVYNMMGQKVDENYKGLVIKNGKKFIQK